MNATTNEQIPTPFAVHRGPVAAAADASAVTQVVVEEHPQVKQSCSVRQPRQIIAIVAKLAVGRFYCVYKIDKPIYCCENKRS